MKRDVGARMKTESYRVGLLAVTVLAVTACDLLTTRKTPPERRARAGGNALIFAARAFHDDHHRFPTNVAELAEGDKRYLTRHVLDPWGQEYMLFTNSTNQVLVLSRGPDGELSTDDDIVTVK